MSGASKIEWTDATWNPVRGCTRVSDGCKNCYAERVAMRQSNPGGAYEGLVHQTSQGPKWTGVIRTVPELLDWPLRRRKPSRVFVNSMSDLFHEDVEVEFIADVFAAMAYARQHTFQVLTKRPERMLKILTDGDWINDTYDGATALAHDVACEVLGRRGEFDPNRRRRDDIRAFNPALPLTNVWLGVSVEDQATADERIPLLLQTPAAVRWISAEPLLGPILLRRHIDVTRDSVVEGQIVVDHSRLDWVVAGGESGPKARPSHPDWFRSLRDQCAAAGVAYFFKQWGNWRPIGPLYEDNDTAEHLDALDTDPDIYPKECWVTPSGHRWPPSDGQAPVGTWAMCRDTKFVTGRELDGRTHDEYPA